MAYHAWRLANFYSEEGDLERAELYFKKSLGSGANDAAAHYFYARFLVEVGRNEDAKPLLRRAVSLGKDYKEAEELLMSLGESNGKQSGAFKRGFNSKMMGIAVVMRGVHLRI